MKLTHARFVDCGIESDIQMMRREVYTLQNRVNSLSKLRKDLAKASAEELENYVLESGLGPVYEKAAAVAKSMTRNDYVQFIQSGGLQNIIGANNGINQESASKESSQEESGQEESGKEDNKESNKEVAGA